MNALESVTPSCVAQRTVRVIANDRVARGTFRLRLEDPEMARVILPGQFVMVRAGQGSDPLLGRPFALYEVVRDSQGESIAIDLVYLVIGRGTSALASCKPGDLLPIWGPLGNGFGPSPEGPVVFVAGGIGQTPFLALGRWWLGQARYAGRDAGPFRADSATLLYGVRNVELAACVDEFKDAGIGVELATDDGSAGHHGYATDLLARRLEAGERPAKVVGCGPHPMLATLARLTARYEIPCDLSLENHMACGFCACFSCVAPIRQEDGSTDLKRVCVEGPIFQAGDVVFDHA